MIGLILALIAITLLAAAMAGVRGVIVVALLCTWVPLIGMLAGWY